MAGAGSTVRTREDASGLSGWMRPEQLAEAVRGLYSVSVAWGASDLSLEASEGVPGGGKREGKWVVSQEPWGAWPMEEQHSKRIGECEEFGAATTKFRMI